MKAILKLLILVVTVVTVSAGAVDAQRFAGGARPSDSRSLDAQIFHQIMKLPNYGLFDDIKYEVQGGTVILSGSVASLGTKRDAASVVKRIPGVQRVVNNIRELPPSSFDNQIRRALVRQIANSPGLYRYLQGPNPSVRLIVDNGHVALEGYVSSRGDANTLNILANGISGVFSVENHLMLTREQ
jgi:hyperosmotically inducible periplasmic protein